LETYEWRNSLINWHFNCLNSDEPTSNVMKTFCAIILCLLLTSCIQEDLDPSDYEFRGSWDSSKYAMQIFMNGSATLNIRNRGNLNGYVKINGDNMTFYSNTEDDAIGYKRFNIDERPTTDGNGITYMVLEGHRLEKH
jgi:hypothetical protein